MSETYSNLIPAFAGGVLLGALFFAGLWLSVRKLGRAKRPGLLMVVSYVVRMSVAMGGLYLLSNGDWQKLAAALTGLILVRILMVRILTGRGRRSMIAVRGER